MFIQTEVTPNPQTLKFLPGRVVMEEGTNFFQNISECTHSPFAKRLFNLDGISSVFFGSDFISITKEENQEWQTLKPIVLGAITDHFNSGEKVINKNHALNQNDKNDPLTSLKKEDIDNDIVKQIKELLDTKVRPAVAMDGGDIVFHEFKEGIVYLHMQGACSGCPSSTATLRMGIENMLKHYVPDVKEVRAVNN